MNETIVWIDAKQVLPDADATVLVFNRFWNEPVEMGFFDVAEWRNAHGESYDIPPTHWADIPEGPQ